MVEVRAEVRPLALPPAAGGARRRAAPARRRAGAPAARGAAGRRPRAAQPARDRVVRRLGAGAAAARRRWRACASRSGPRTTCGPFCERFRDDPLIGPSVRRAPWLRARRRARALRGARVGGLRAAHRVRARDRDPAPDRPRARAAVPATPACATSPPRPRSRGWRPRGCRHGPQRRPRARAASGRARGGRRARRPARRRPRAGLAAPAGDPGHRLLDLEMLALHGQGRYDVLPAGDLGLPQARRPRCRPGDPRARVEEAEVRALLRALRGLGRPGRRSTRCAPRARLRARSRRRGGRLRLEPLARQELVRERAAARRGGSREQPVVEHPRP